MGSEDAPTGSSEHGRPTIVSNSLDVLKQNALLKRFPQDIPADSMNPQEVALPMQILTLEDHLGQLRGATQANDGTLTTYFAPSQRNHTLTLMGHRQNPNLKLEYYGEGTEPPYVDIIYYCNKSGENGYRLSVNFGEIPGKEDELPLQYDSRRKGISGITKHEYNVVSYFVGKVLTDINTPRLTSGDSQI